MSTSFRGKGKEEAGEIAQLLRALVALAGDLGSIPSTQIKRLAAVLDYSSWGFEARF